MMREREEKKKLEAERKRAGEETSKRKVGWRSGCEPSRPERCPTPFHRRSPSTAFDRVTSEYKGKISPTCNVEKKRNRERAKY